MCILYSLSLCSFVYTKIAWMITSLKTNHSKRSNAFFVGGDLEGEETWHHSCFSTLWARTLYVSNSFRRLSTSFCFSFSCVDLLCVLDSRAIICLSNWLTRVLPSLALFSFLKNIYVTLRILYLFMECWTLGLESENIP